MGQIDRLARSATLAALAVGALLAGAQLASSAPAQQKPPAAPAANDPAAQKLQAQQAAQRAYEGGLKSYQNGKYEASAQQISEALRLGGLNSNDMARALYTRGLGYKKLSKPGLAISDLTSALWLKNGLNEADRQSATVERAEAYRQAGLGEAPQVSANAAIATAPASSTQTQAAVAAPVATAPAATLPATASVQAPTPQTNLTAAAGVTRQSGESEAAQDAARARRLAAQPVDSGGLTGAFSSLTGNASTSPPAVVQTAVPVAAPTPVADVAVAAPAAVAPPDSSAYVAAGDQPSFSAVPTDGQTTTAAAASTGGSNTVAGFFSNLFSGGSNTQTAAAPPPPATSLTSAAASPVTTASTTPLASQPPAVSAQGATTSGWQQAAVTPAAAPAASKAPAVGAPKTAAASKVKGGKYKLHIAAFRTRAEAEAVAQRLTQTNANDLANRPPMVDEAVIGSMGTFYRVRVGSYANADEPRGVCNKIRTSGFDCLVVTN